MTVPSVMVDVRTAERRGNLESTPPFQWRTIFVSDLHLGTQGCQANDFLEFLRQNDAETIYLVGDIVDFWRIRHRPYWTQEQNDILQKILRKGRKGTQIVLLPGNHDEAFDAFIGCSFGNIEVRSEAVHETADGRRLLVVHGDHFDGVVYYARSLLWLGNWSTTIAMWITGPFTAIRFRLGVSRWSLAAHLKQNFKQATNLIARFEKTLSSEAERRGLDGVICGHIHHADDKMINGLRYLNCGDWVSSRTALAEDSAGRICLLRWANRSIDSTSLPEIETTSSEVAIAA
jgi:UDP-2,3-diacylglucosamine pyrophosphatase LpxH